MLLTGNGPSPRDGGWAFCSGGDQRIRGSDGYKYAEGDDRRRRSSRARRTAAHPRGAAPDPLHAQGRDLRRARAGRPAAATACTSSCDLTLASAEHARFKQTDADVASFDGGFGSAYLARQVGQKFAREIFFLGREYSADDDHRMGAVNAVVPHAELEATALQWAAEINAKSPTAQRMLKYAFNLIDDGLVGQQLFAGEATRLAYGTDEADEGRDVVPREARPGLVPLPLACTETPRPSAHAVLLLSCPDQRGHRRRRRRVHRRHDGNIVHAEQHIDEIEGVFFQRVEFDLDGFDLDRDEILAAFAPVAERFAHGRRPALHRRAAARSRSSPRSSRTASTTC